MNVLSVHTPVAHALYACLFLLVCGQLAHALLCTKRADSSPLRCAYEFSLVVQLFVCVALVQLSVTGNVSGFVYLFALKAPADLLLYVSVPCALLAVFVAVRCRRVGESVEAVLLLCFTPPFVSALDDSYVFLIIVECGYVLFRTASNLAVDRVVLRRQPSPLSCVDALDVLPEGVLYADMRGRVVFMNNRMRSCLNGLGAPADLSSADEIAAFLGLPAASKMPSRRIPTRRCASCASSCRTARRCCSTSAMSCCAPGTAVASPPLT